MATHSKYNINATSKKSWEPYQSDSKSINNRSSVKHNIISHEENNYTPSLVIGLMDKRLTNIKKGIAEFGDIQRPTALNQNMEHLNSLKDNPDIFKRKNGAFTYLYDSAHRFGESKPFK
eukprot:CAMPEP_0170548268 /NCGR_PEP_ID=MMETSP0211-20121228/6606_1 /TAXON_ID=311385 /ORGANISM="Pseudokeronopsis sp., Strain OXSARD2" /LENGTH=118 /DNA_ID=CAMNT_0010853735 /DNA_START=345 /DNA_END=698 /DNA_ORIENTATION=+